MKSRTLLLATVFALAGVTLAVGNIAAQEKFCVVPGARKAMAVKAMLSGPVDGSCPASVSRRHPACTLYLDAESASLWLETMP